MKENKKIAKKHKALITKNSIVGKITLKCSKENQD